MFRAPNIIADIPELNQIYNINENQISSIVSDIDGIRTKMGRCNNTKMGKLYRKEGN